jgi:hypothetical protein
MVWQCFDSVYLKAFGYLFNFFAAETIDNSRFSGLRFYIFDNVFDGLIAFRSYFIIQVWPVE